MGSTCNLFISTALFTTVAWADTIELYCRDSSGAESFAVVVGEMSKSLVFNGESIDAMNRGGGSPQYIWRWRETETAYRLRLDRQTLQFEYWETWRGEKIAITGVCQKLDLKI